MSDVTTSREYEWTQRATFKSSIVTCLACGGARREGAGRHAPRWVHVKGGHIQVDCAGRPVFQPLRLDVSGGA